MSISKIGGHGGKNPMADQNSATLQALMQFAFPFGSALVTGSPDTLINWAITLRAQPPAFPDVYGGELALVSMEIIYGFEPRMTLAEVVQGLAEVGVSAIAAKDEITQMAIAAATERRVALISLPTDTILNSVERSVNKLIVNQQAQLNERALEIQRQLARLAAENRGDMNGLLQLMARATAKAIVVHDDAGVIMAQITPSVSATSAKRNLGNGRGLLQSVPYNAFQTWLAHGEAPSVSGVIVRSPIGHTTMLKVEKRVAGYLSVIDTNDGLNEFDRLVLTYGADVCAMELAKNRAVSAAVEQTRGDWIQMWLTNSGNANDDEMTIIRAQQAGFDTAGSYAVGVFRASSDNGMILPLDGLISLVRDDLARRQIEGTVGQFGDMIVTLYPLEQPQHLARVRAAAEELRAQLAVRSASGLVSGGISRPAVGLLALREAYREAKDALTIATELGERDRTTFYGDLKLFQFLLGLKDQSLDQLKRFHQETLGPLAQHDERKHGDLIRTLNGFFEANGNLAKAATELDVHRNTLVYRLERISELTGLDLNDAENRLILSLALKIQRVLATVPQV
jgi:PucR family transcriptional regulator, purine catabolism regulatory protein